MQIVIHQISVIFPLFALREERQHDRADDADDDEQRDQLKGKGELVQKYPAQFLGGHDKRFGAACGSEGPR